MCRCAWPATLAIASGVGERLQPAPALPSCAVLLVNPGGKLATADVFAARRGSFAAERPMSRPWSDLAGFVAALAERGNDLTEPAIALQPMVGEVLAFLRQTPGALHAAMSGSGATCFALYRTQTAAQQAAWHVPAGWWHHAGALARD
jgi:4-diphosphocytidyl-2-C-methyl-D-erythritol kinase